jgi:glycerol-3-phosphate acyltransferase PlsY
VYAFDKPVAVAALAFLVVGDTTAAIVGKSIGRIPIFGKTLEGSLACFLVCLAVGWIIPELSLKQAVAGAAMATLVELLPVPLDDNLRIPLAAGFTMTLIH